MIFEILLYAAIGVLAVILIVLTALCIKRKREVCRITESINRYIQSGAVADFSPKEGYIAELQNAVFDMETLIEREKQNTKEMSKQNTEFVSDISHQLKTPIAGLRLYCEMEHSQHPSEHTEKELQLIEKMENLVYRLLRLEKIRSDAYVMDFRTYDSADFINPIVSDFRHLFPQKEYKVRADGKIRCDKEWLGEAVGNLIKNASEHTEQNGRVEITVNDTGDFTEITVQDNGGGVPEKDLPLLFTRFHKTNNALPSSAGIGLAITKAVVEKHHGTVSAENKNSGLCVVICLPHIDGYVLI